MVRASGQVHGGCRSGGSVLTRTERCLGKLAVADEARGVRHVEEMKHPGEEGGHP